MSLITKILHEADDDFFKPRKVDARVKAEELRKQKFTKEMSKGHAYMLNYIQTHLPKQYQDSEVRCSYQRGSSGLIFDGEINYHQCRITFWTYVEHHNQGLGLMYLKVFHNSIIGCVCSFTLEVLSIKEFMQAINDIFVDPEVEKYLGTLNKPK